VFAEPAVGGDLHRDFQRGVVDDLQLADGDAGVVDVNFFRVGEPADLIEVDSLSGFNVLRTWINGQLVAENGKTTIPRVEPHVANKFVANRLDPLNLAVQAPANGAAKK
jgi:adenine deaminase